MCKASVGDHCLGRVDAVRERGEGRDLVALAVDLPLGQDLSVVGHCSDQGGGRLVSGAGAAECPAVDGDGPATGGRGLAFLEGASDGPVQGVAVRGSQDEADGRGVGRPEQGGQRVGAEPGQGQDGLRRVGDPLTDRG